MSWGRPPWRFLSLRRVHVRTTYSPVVVGTPGSLWGASWRLLGFVIRFSIACDRHFQGYIFGRFRKTVLEPLTQLKCTMRALPPAIVARISAKVRERRDSLVEASTSG